MYSSKHYILRISLLIGLSLILFSCSEEVVEESPSVQTFEEEIFISPNQNRKVVLHLYRDEELKANQAFIKAMQTILDRSFDKQFEEFEDNEMGIISSYQNMFKYFFSSKTDWEDNLRLKIDRYFNSLDVSQELLLLKQKHIKNIEIMRQHCSKSIGEDNWSSISLDLPSQNVSLKTFGSRVTTSVILDHGINDFAGWLIGLFIVWILSLFAIAGGENGCLITIIATIITLPLSIYFCSKNADNLKAEIGEHQITLMKENLVDIETSLNANTIKFYEKAKFN